MRYPFNIDQCNVASMFESRGSSAEFDRISLEALPSFLLSEFFVLSFTDFYCS